jgi:hypothetical protein
MTTNATGSGMIERSRLVETPADVAVMRTCPTVRALSCPVELTAATEVSLELHTISRSTSVAPDVPIARADNGTVLPTMMA